MLQINKISGRNTKSVRCIMRHNGISQSLGEASASVTIPIFLQMVKILLKSTVHHNYYSQQKVITGQCTHGSGSSGRS